MKTKRSNERYSPFLRRLRHYVVTFTDLTHAGDEQAIVECDAPNRRYAPHLAYLQLCEDRKQVEADHHIKLDLKNLRVERVRYMPAARQPSGRN